MPKSNHIHKSMLLKGILFPSPALTASDIETTKGKAARSGRQHGGVPLQGDGRGRNSFNYATSNQHPSQQQSRGPQNGYNQNPFPVWQPPAPGTGGFARGPPPPPPGTYGYAQPQSYGYNAPGRGPPSYNDDRRRSGDSYRGENGDAYRGQRDPYRGQYRGR